VRVLVSDASVLIELSRWSLLDVMFRLPYEFAVPDALYEDELIDLGRYDRESLKAAGMRVESLDPNGLERALWYQQARPKLTLHDCFAITLAVTQGWSLLTGDRRMRALAEQEQVEVHGVLWLIDQFGEQGVVPRATLIDTLQAMRADPRSHLPLAEIDRRLRSLASGDG
jgi:predicted nucleic acid-binding protein